MLASPVLASPDPLPKQAASTSYFEAASGPATPQRLAAGEAHWPSPSLCPAPAWGALCSAAPASRTPDPAHVLFMPLSHLSNYTEGCTTSPKITETHTTSFGGRVGRSGKCTSRWVLAPTGLVSRETTFSADAASERGLSLHRQPFWDSLAFNFSRGGGLFLCHVTDRSRESFSVKINHLKQGDICQNTFSGPVNQILSLNHLTALKNSLSPY